MRTITLKFIKEHKVLAEYAEVKSDGEKVLKPFVQPLYLRKSELGNPLPVAFTITLTPVTE